MRDDSNRADSPRACGFPPAAGPDARVLILGSLPGVRSIELQQYYGLPRNAFWRIMGAICGAGPELAYPLRLQRLIESGIALWDVMAEGHRRGSLDSAIVSSSVAVNDIPGFLARHDAIGTVCFNGRKAAQLYRRHVLPALPGNASIAEHELPSTSPAHATRSVEQKLQAWREVLVQELRINQTKADREALGGAFRHRP